MLILSFGEYPSIDSAPWQAEGRLGLPDFGICAVHLLAVLDDLRL